MNQPLNESDLNALIEEHLSDCKSGQICDLISTPVGKERVVKRIKEIITEDGITSIEAVLAQLETELIFGDEEE